MDRIEGFKVVLVCSGCGDKYLVFAAHVDELTEILEDWGFRIEIWVGATIVNCRKCIADVDFYDKWMELTEDGSKPYPIP